MPSATDELSNREVMLILQHLAAELPTGGQPHDPDVTDAVLNEFLARAPVTAAGAPTVADAARQALEMALADPATSELARDLVEDPPHDDQMGVEVLAEHIPVALFVLSFLQTKFHVRISRSGGKTDVEFEIGKDALSPAAMEKVISIAEAVVATGGAKS